MNKHGDKPMPNNMKWFKVWETLLIDMIIHNISLEDIGRFTILGLLITKKGKKGNVMITPEALKTYFKCEKLPEKFVIDFNVNDNANDNGTRSVSLKNWRKYQENTSGYTRLKRWRLKHNDNANDNTNDNANDNANETRKIRLDKIKIRKDKIIKQGFDFLKIPDFINLKTWQAYLEMRKSIKKPLKTEHQFNLAISTLQKLQSQGHNPNDVLNQSILNSWQGLFELKKSKNKTGGQQDAFTGTPYKNAAEKYAGVGKIPDKDKSTDNAGVGKIPTTKLDGNSTKIS